MVWACLTPLDSTSLLDILLHKVAVGRGFSHPHKNIGAIDMKVQLIHKEIWYFRKQGIQLGEKLLDHCNIWCT